MAGLTKVLRRKFNTYTENVEKTGKQFQLWACLDCGRVLRFPVHSPVAKEILGHFFYQADIADELRDHLLFDCTKGKGKDWDGV